MSGCSTIIPYDKSDEIVIEEVEIKPPGAKIINRLGDQSIIHSKNKIQIKRKTWNGMQFDLPIPIPYSWGRANGGEELDIPPGLVAQWPSGATAPIEKKPYYLPNFRNPVYTLEANHPDERGSSRYEYDQWINYHGVCSQSVRFVVSPECLEYSIDQSPFIQADSDTIQHNWSFNYDEYDRGNKDVVIVFKWPSGVMSAITSIPINSSRKLYNSSAPAQELVNISHPMPKSTMYSYDMINKYQRHVEVTLQTTPRGANIYLNDNNVGVTPVSWMEQISYDDYLNGNKNISLRSVWNSGATVKTNISLNIVIGQRRLVVIDRPPNYEDLESDLKYASQLDIADNSRATTSSKPLPIQISSTIPDNKRVETIVPNEFILDSKTDHSSEYIARQQDLNRQLLDNQRRAIAEMERSNRAREEQLSRENTLRSVQMLNQSLQNIGNIYQNTAPSAKTTYEIRPSVIDLIPHDGLMDAGSFENPYIIESK